MMIRRDIAGYEAIVRCWPQGTDLTLMVIGPFRVLAILVCSAHFSIMDSQAWWETGESATVA